ncbi:hypothetical protein FOA52_013850 [Chlamydomonas sp. UWO 241]|nr:hypothetical protein FOA52_013850 [Chlamydomonas sp. UWO 241]
MRTRAGSFTAARTAIGHAYLAAYARQVTVPRALPLLVASSFDAVSFDEEESCSAAAGGGAGVNEHQQQRERDQQQREREEQQEQDQKKQQRQQQGPSPWSWSNNPLSRVLSLFDFTARRGVAQKQPTAQQTLQAARKARFQLLLQQKEAQAQRDQCDFVDAPSSHHSAVGAVGAHVHAHAHEHARASAARAAPASNSRQHTVGGTISGTAVRTAGGTPPSGTAGAARYLLTQRVMTGAMRLRPHQLRAMLIAGRHVLAEGMQQASAPVRSPAVADAGAPTSAAAAVAAAAWGAAGTVATALAGETPQQWRLMSPFITIAPPADVRACALMSDLSNMAYEPQRVNDAMLSRHGLTFVTHSAATVLGAITRDGHAERVRAWQGGGGDVGSSAERARHAAAAAAATAGSGATGLALGGGSTTATHAAAPPHAAAPAPAAGAAPGATSSPFTTAAHSSASDVLASDLLHGPAGLGTAAPPLTPPDAAPNSLALPTHHHHGHSYPFLQYSVALNSVDDLLDIAPPMGSLDSLASMDGDCHYPSSTWVTAAVMLQRQQAQALAEGGGGASGSRHHAGPHPDIELALMLGSVEDMISTIDMVDTFDALDATMGTLDSIDETSTSLPLHTSIAAYAPTLRGCDSMATMDDDDEETECSLSPGGGGGAGEKLPIRPITMASLDGLDTTPEAVAAFNFMAMPIDLTAAAASHAAVAARVHTAAGESVDSPMARRLSGDGATPSAPNAWFVADDLKAGTRHFIVQGSMHMGHWLVNIKFEPAIFEDPALGVRVHRGVYEAALELYDDMLPCVQQHLASTARTEGKVSLGGHSLGGSLATVLTLLLVHRGQVPIERLAPCYAFGAPAVLCTSAGCGPSLCSTGGGGTSGLLERLGIPNDRLVNVIMHRDIVPRVFVSDYGQVGTGLLQRWMPSFKDHSCLSDHGDPHGHSRSLYSFVGRLLIIRPDDGADFVHSDAAHPHLPDVAALYDVNEDRDHPGALRPALLQFFNDPHPMTMLSLYASYGPNGAISRYHNPDNYTKALVGVPGYSDRAGRGGHI